jgi:hypothetical protein
MDLGEWKIPPSASGLRNTLFNVEPLNDASTPLGKRRVSARLGWAGEEGDFFSSLLGQGIWIGKVENMVGDTGIEPVASSV